MGGECGTHEREAKCRLLFGKPEGRGPFGRPRRRCVAIKIYIEEKGCETVVQIITLRVGTSETLTNYGVP
jgi:hypothetical protein